MTEPTKESRVQALAMLEEESWYLGGYNINGPDVTVLARTLDKLYGRTPVDPLLAEARKIWAERDQNKGYQYLAGDRDGYFEMLNTMDDLRRGMKLAPEPRMPTEAETRETLARFYELDECAIVAKSIRAGDYSTVTEAFRTAIIEMLEKINKREGV